jgi:hypothetical protein
MSRNKRRIGGRRCGRLLGDRLFCGRLFRYGLGRRFRCGTFGRCLRGRGLRWSWRLYGRLRRCRIGSWRRFFSSRRGWCFNAGRRCECDALVERRRPQAGAFSQERGFCGSLGIGIVAAAGRHIRFICSGQRRILGVSR